MDQPIDQPQVTTQEYIDAIKEAKANGQAMSINYGDLPSGVVAAAVHTAMSDGLPQEYQDAIGEAAAKGKTISLDFSQIKPAGPISTVDILKDAARMAVQTAMPSSNFDKPLQPTSGNPAMGAIQAAVQTMRDPTRIASTLSQPGQAAGQAVQNAVGPNHPILGKVANVVTSAALDPSTYALGPLGEAEAKVADLAVQTVGEKVLAPLGEVASATRTKDIVRLFKNPMEVLFSPSLKESGSVMGTVEKALGVTEDELRLIAKAGDRATGGSRTVVEGLMQKGKELATQAGDKPENWSTYLSPGELIAGRRAASKLSVVAKGREGYIAAQDVKSFETAFVDKAKEKAITYLQALKDQTNARTRSAFMNLLPLNKNMSHNALRGSLAAGAAFTGHPLAALAASPAVTGIGTLAAKGAYKVGQAVISNPIATKATGAGTLAAIRAFLQKSQLQPGS